MVITKIVVPYEFLVRWKNGKISGAHVKFLETISEDGVVVSEKEGMAQPVSMAGELGYPIADIFAAIRLDSVATAQAAVTACSDAHAAEAQAKDAQATAEKAQAEAKLAADAAEAEAKRLTDALAAQVAAEKAVADKVVFDAAVAKAAAELVAATPA